MYKFNCGSAIKTILMALVFFVPFFAEANDRPFPQNIDPSKHYVLYMHGNYVERQGAYGSYRYYDILDAVEGKGFVVIGEARGATNMRTYAKKVSKQVGGLLKAGVPIENILIAGHSRGGFMSLLVAANLQNPQARFGVLAGCGLKGTKFYPPYKSLLKIGAAKMKGKFLVMWEQNDTVSGNCDAAMEKATDVSYENMMLTVGGGHELFYDPKSSWIDPLVAFAKK